MRRRKKNKSQSELDYRKAIEELCERALDTKQEVNAYRNAIQHWRQMARVAPPSWATTNTGWATTNTGWATTNTGWAMTTSGFSSSPGYALGVPNSQSMPRPQPEAQFNPRPEVPKDIAASPIIGYRYWLIWFGPEVAALARPAQSITTSGSSGAHTHPLGISGIATTNTIAPISGGGPIPMYPPYARSQPDVGLLIRSIFRLADELERGVPLAEALRNLVPVNLLSANNVPWEPGARAVCTATQGHGKSLMTYCTCGYWALQDEAHVRARFGLSDQSAHGYAVGSVELYGRVIEHEHGWRGEYARPRDLRFYNVDERVAAQVAKRYGCNVLSVTP